MKSKLENLLDMVDSMISSKPVSVMNVALWLIFVCIVFLIGII